MSSNPLLIHSAIIRHDLVQILCLFQAHPRWVHNAIYYRHALIVGHVPTVAAFLDRGRKVDWDLNSGETESITGSSSPLMIACITENLALVQLLIQRGCDPNARDDMGATILMRCIIKRILNPHRHYDIIKYLLLNGADVHAIVYSSHDNMYETALTMAICLQNIMIVPLLLKFGAKLSPHHPRLRSSPDRAVLEQMITNAVAVIED